MTKWQGQPEGLKQANRERTRAALDRQEAAKRAFEVKHPRHPAGTREGGRFRPGDTVTGRLVVSPLVKVEGEVVSVHDAGLLVKLDNGEERLVSEGSAEHTGSSGLAGSGGTMPGVRSPQAPARPRGPLNRRRYDPEALIAAGKWSKEQQAKIAKVMREFKAGTLKSRDGSKVTNKRQALAIALSEARSLTAAGKWDESKHPRDPGGEGGGQWIGKGEGAADEGPSNATDFDEAGGENIYSYGESVEEAANDIVDNILESMSHGEGEEGLGDEASQGRGYGDQLDEEVAMFRESGMLEDMTRDWMDDLAQEDPEFDPEKFMNEVEARVTKKLRENGETASAALTASAAGLAPMIPPRGWFDKPNLEGPTAITVTADGRVYGHAALWGTCHTGMPGVCRTPPRSSSDYAYFHLGEVDTDGGPVAVGRVTMDTGHAPLTASRDGAVRHYDHTGTQIAHVRAYEDEHGIVLAGALVPDAPAEKARRFKGATVSGDWRSIQGKLEMVGMLAVNVPGFPVPRAMAASLVVEDEPHTMALVAAGVYCSPEEEARKLKALTARALGGVEGLAAAAGYEPKDRRRMGVTAASRPFDPSKHPREPGGSKVGGRWAKVTRTDGSGEVTYREGLPSQVVRELQAEGETVGGPDATVRVSPLPPGTTPEEEARINSGEPGFVQDTVEISKHGLKYRGTIVKVTPGAAMVEYTTNNGKTKTVRVPHREYKVIG